MTDDLRQLKGVVLAAGVGTRLRPLTYARPKPLCPVGDRTLLAWALERVRPYVGSLAVNAHYLADQVVAALVSVGSSVPLHVSVEAPEALGTAGALGRLRDWLNGAPVLLTNADAWYPPTARPLLDDFVAGWDGERVRLLCTPTDGPADFDMLRYVGLALLPWPAVRDLRPEPSGLYEVSWAVLHEQGRLDLVAREPSDLGVIDCGTPADYLRANLAATGGQSVVEPGARVHGEIVRSVVWAGEVVTREERLVEAIRGGGHTLYPLRPR